MIVTEIASPKAGSFPTPQITAALFPTLRMMCEVISVISFIVISSVPEVIFSKISFAPKISLLFSNGLSRASDIAVSPCLRRKPGLRP